MNDGIINTNMADQKLEKYVVDSRQRVTSDDVIRQEFVEAGSNATDLNAATFAISEPRLSHRHGLLFWVMTTFVIIVCGAAAFAFTTETGKVLIGKIVPLSQSLKTENEIFQSNNFNTNTTIIESETPTENSDVLSQFEVNSVTSQLDKTPILYLADGDTFPSKAPYVFIQGPNAKTNPISITVNGSSIIKPVPYGSKVDLKWDAMGMKKCNVGGQVGIPYVAGGYIGDDADSARVFTGSDSISFYARVFNNYSEKIIIQLNCSAGEGTSFVNIDVSIVMAVLKPTTIFTFTSPTSEQIFTYNDKIKLTWTSSQPVSTILTSLHRSLDNHELHPDAAGTPRLTSGEIDSLSWTVPMKVPPGQYYVRVYELNRVPVNYKSQVFIIKDLGGQYNSYVDTLKLMAQSSTVKTQHLIYQAYLEKDISLCESISAEYYKYKCFLDVAQAVGNARFCFNIPADYTGTSQTRNKCFYLVAQKIYDPRVCENIQESRDASVASCKASVKEK